MTETQKLQAERQWPHEWTVQIVDEGGLGTIKWEGGARDAAMALQMAADLHGWKLPVGVLRIEFDDVNRDGTRFEQVDWTTGDTLVVERNG